MTKEKFLNTLKSMSGNDNHMHIIISMIEKFFDSNVCIPKGENRHEYADVLHEWIEDTSKQLEWFNNNYQDTSLHEWVIMPDRLIYIDKKMRIKPSEPIYEWQWYDIDRNREVFIVNRGHFMTEDECGELTTFGKMCKFEETKRERKWVRT